ncbi:hypothetical protein PTKIN_Ptkin09bG0263400 [Pterospermum kingtungense]
MMFVARHANGKNSTPICVAIHGAKKGDTCFGLAQAFNLTLDYFKQNNPNLDCDKIFVGQWLCIYVVEQIAEYHAADPSNKKSWKGSILVIQALFCWSKA